ncbi:MAG: hypothetical protein AAF541_24015 [Pseudomonadota bacterium]
MSEIPSAEQGANSSSPAHVGAIHVKENIQEGVDRKGAIRVAEAHDATHASSDPTRESSIEPVPERRIGPADRRVADEDRRNEDRLNDELDPRRNPDMTDRRVN